MRRHVAGPDQRLVLWNSRRHDGVGVDSLLKQIFPELETLHHITDNDRYDGGLAGPNAESKGVELFPHEVRNLLETLQSPGLLLQDLQSLEHRGHIGRWHTCTEDVRRGLMTDVVYNRLLTDNKPTQRGKGF